jgi:eukaryotic-like serine/threonine-protein kinase
MADERFTETMAAPSIGALPGDAEAASGSPIGPPTLADRYVILGMLGAGGMGNVYKARDLELEELVALKVLRPELVGAPGVLDRFRREVKLARRVTHPNVARVFDIGDHRGEKFLTMELIDGESLGALLVRERRLPVARVVTLASAICAGLSAAHAAGVIHRDLKPDNVLLDRSGRVVVTDFGIARAVSPGADRTVSNFVGTPAYMAPEQVEEGMEIDARADLYALGAMLYEIVVGEPAWQGSSVLGIAVARLLKPPPDPRVKRPDLPDGLATLILRCMARDPADRPASADEVAGAFAGLTLPAMDRSLTMLPEPSVDVRGAFAKRVAVLPFRNAGAPEHEYLADGLTEELIDLLSVSPGLRVRSRGVVMRFKGLDRDPRDLGRELDVQVVVEGSVRRSGGTARISARAISVADGFQLWARRFDRPDAELLAMTDEAAQAIATALTVELGAPPRLIASDPEAADLYLRARAAYHRFFSDLGGNSIDLFERAMTRAPDDPRVLAGYAIARARWGDPEAGGRHSAEVAATRAVALAPHLAEPHLALAQIRYQSGDEAGAVRPIRRALRVSPNNGESHDLLGRILSETTRLADARRHLEIAVALEPDHHLPVLSLCRTYELGGEHAALERFIEARPDRDTTAAVMSRILMWRRDAARAAQMLETLPTTGGANRVFRALLLLATRGEPPFAVLQTVFEKSKGRPLMFACQLEAECALALGDTERGLAAIERASGLALFDQAWMDFCPPLAVVREHPRFLAVKALVDERAARLVEAYLAPDT